jgi:methylmalonyl-CoA/ethylmalonyl-CoA epimerase
MSNRLDHIGVAVPSLEKALPFWSEGLGLEVRGIETVEGERVKVAFLSAGGPTIELLEPTDPSSTIARHLERRGGGIHHLTLEVPDIGVALDLARSKGGELIGDGLRRGAGVRLVAFLHPRSTGGVLVELVEASAAASDGWTMGAGSAVLLYLHTPSEKLWGVLRRLDATGVIVEAIDLGSFDDWVAQVEREESSIVGPSVVFIPMGRLEKMLLDRPSGDLPSLSERFERRTGRSVQDVLGD